MKLTDLIASKFARLSKRGRTAVVVAIVAVIVLITLVIVMNYQQANKTETRLREAVSANTSVETDKVSIRQTLATKDGWTVAIAENRDNTENTIYVIYQTDASGKITVWDSGTGFDVPTMTDANIPAEIQAAVLGIDVDEAKQQIADYQAYGRPVIIDGLNILTNRGVDSAVVDTIRNILSAYFNNAKGSSHPAKQVVIGSDIGYSAEFAADGEPIKTYTATLTIDDKTQKQLIFTIGDYGLRRVAIANSDSGGAETVFNTTAD
jgi:uncharacterized protein YpmB